MSIYSVISFKKLLSSAAILYKQLSVYSQVYTLRHDITNVQSLMPGLILAIRKVVRLKVINQQK